MGAKGDVTMTFDGQTAAFIQSVMRAKSALEKTTDQTDEAGKKFRKTGDIAGEMGKKLMESFIGPLSAVGAVTTAVAAGTAALRAMNEEAQRGADLAKNAELGLSQLAQLAGGDINKFKNLIAQAEKLFQSGQAESLTEASTTVFQAVSAGFDNELDFVGKLKGVVKSPGEVAKSAKTLQASLGKDETGSFSDIVSKALAASAFNPSEMERLLEGAAQSGASGKLLGLGDEEILAATALASEAAGGAEQGSTQVKSLLIALAKDEKGRFKGKSIPESIKTIQDMNLSDPELIKFFGRKEALGAFSSISNQLPKFQEILGAITDAERDDLAGKTLSLPGQVPELEQSKGVREDQNRLDNLIKDRFGVDRLKSERFLIQEQEKDINEDQNFLRRFGRKSVREGARLFTDNTDVIGKSDDQAENLGRLSLAMSTMGSSEVTIWFSKLVDALQENTKARENETNTNIHAE